MAVTRRYPEQIPAAACWPRLSDDHCLLCPAPPQVVLWKVSAIEDVDLWPSSSAAVIEAQVCGSHATRYEDEWEGATWCVVLDRRQSMTDGEIRR